MQEIAAFRWNEAELAHTAVELRGTRQPFTAADGGELCLGGGHALRGNNGVAWRFSGQGNLDVSVVSWTDARATLTRRFVLSAPPCRNGVFFCESEGRNGSALALCCTTGEIFFVTDPFKAEYKPRLVKSIGGVPTACCWSRPETVKGEVLGWFGLDSGMTSCLRFSVSGNYLSTISFDPVTGPIGWLSSLSGPKKSSVLCLMPSTDHPETVAALYANGQGRLLTVHLREGSAQMSEISQIFDNGDPDFRWHDGRIMALDGLRFMFSVVSAQEGMECQPFSVDWRQSTAPRREEMRLLGLNDDDDSYKLRAVTQNLTGTRPIGIYWSEDQRSGLIRDSDGTELRDEVPHAINLLVSPAVQEIALPAICERLVGHFAPHHIETSLMKTFSVSSAEDAFSIFESASADRRMPFLSLFKSNIQRLWEADQEPLDVFYGFAPSTICAVVRRHGLSFLVSSVAHKALSAAPVGVDQVLSIDLQSELRRQIALHVEQDLPQLLIGKPHLMQFSFNAGFNPQALDSLDKVQRYISTFDDPEEEQNVMTTEGSITTISAIIVGDLLRKRSLGLIWSRLSLALSLSRVGTTDVVVERVCAETIDASLFQAREAYRVLRCLGRIDVFSSRPRRRKVHPLLVSPKLLVKEKDEPIPASLSSSNDVQLVRGKLFENVSDGGDEESNLIWAWTQTLDSHLSSLDGNSTRFWTALQSKLFSLFSPCSLMRSTSVSWLLLTRPQDYEGLLKPICGSILDQGDYSSLSGRFFSILSGCVATWEATHSGRDYYSDAKKHLMAGTPTESRRALYFSECAKLFEGHSPSTALFFLRHAQMLSHTVTDDIALRELYQRSFLVSLNAGEFLESFNCMIRLDPAMLGSSLERLLSEIVSRRAFDVLLTLPMEQFPNSLLSMCSSKLQQCCLDTPQDRELILAVFGFLSDHKKYQSAAELTFRVAEDVRTSVHDKLAAMNLCISACALIPQRAAAVKAHNGSLVFYSAVVRQHAMIRARVAMQKCLNESQVKGGMRPGPVSNDIKEFLPAALKWLSENVDPLSIIQEGLILALVELAAACGVPLSQRDAIFTTLGECCAKAPFLLDRILKLILLSKGAQSGPKRIRFAACALKSLLTVNARALLNEWWMELFIQGSRLDLFVEILSDHGRWLQASELALRLVPDRSLLHLPQAEAVLPVRVLDKVLSRGRRYRRGGSEAEFVTDVTSVFDEQDLKTAIHVLENALRSLSA